MECNKIIEALFIIIYNKAQPPLGCTVQALLFENEQIDKR